MRATVALTTARILLVKTDQLTRLQIRQWREENRVSRAEDRGRSADSHRQGRDHDGGEAGTPPDLSHRIPKVLLDRVPVFPRRVE